MSSAGAARRAGVPAPGAPSCAATPVSTARAEASRKNGAKSRGPKTSEGKARSALNALKHGMRAAQHVVLPQEDGVAFNALQALLFEELAPVGALQLVLARRIVVAAWRLARADRMEAEALEFRSYEGANAGLALMRDGNGPRSVETLLRYRSAAMAEFTRALRTLKAFQAERTAGAIERPASRPAARVLRRVESNEPERRAAPQLDYARSDPPVSGPTLHDPAAPWLPKRHETGPRRVVRDIGVRVPNEREAARSRSEMSGVRAGSGLAYRSLL